MTVTTIAVPQPRSARWLAPLVLLFGLFLAADAGARDRNPWASPDPAAPAPTFQPQVDGRFAPGDYDPGNDRRRRDTFRFGEPVGPDPTRRLPDPHLGFGVAPGEPGMGLHDPTMPTLPWWSLYGVPGGTGYPGLDPYGAYPGSGMLWPGTGLMAPGPGSFLYGAPLPEAPYRR
ncbi:MAG: hypothetical protein EA347_01570 [Thioalkalivibrio sp.]|nr:MAG: hypothetical protein EA347_01570 [Thioalkalivibrio sp.]